MNKRIKQAYSLGALLLPRTALAMKWGVNKKKRLIAREKRPISERYCLLLKSRRCRYTQHLSRFGPNEQIPNRECIWHRALFICLVYTLPGGSPCSWSPCTACTFSSWSEWMQSRGVECKGLHTLRTVNENKFTARHLDPDLLSKVRNETRQRVMLQSDNAASRKTAHGASVYGRRPSYESLCRVLL